MAGLNVWNGINEQELRTVLAENQRLKTELADCREKLQKAKDKIEIIEGALYHHRESEKFRF